MARDIVIAGGMRDGDGQTVVTNWFAAAGVLAIVRKVDDIVSRGDVIGRIA